MSAWKSPLLFLGFVVIAVAAAALVAPHFVDWNSYRAEFEAYGRKVTGRDVTIAGPIEARLFPWPSLVLHKVRIANPEGMRRAYFIEAGRIDMGMSLAPLMSGRVEVDSIAVDSPVFAFERLASGAASWTIELNRSLPALIDPDRVAVSEISISNGIIFAGDHRRAGLTRIDQLAGTLSAPSLSGPWRVQATARHAGTPFEISLSTGKLKAGEAARVGLRVAPAEAAGLAFSFDGEVARPEGRGLKGAIRIAPASPERAKGDAATGMPQLEVKAEIEADFDTVALSKIEASPALSSDPGNYITGGAQIVFGQRVAVDTVLATARLDIDQIAGRRGREVMRSAGALDELSLLLGRLPDALDLHVDLEAASVMVGGETLEASRLEFDLGQGQLRIENFTTALPGQTRTSFSGLLLFGDGEPLMSGDISLRSASLKDFAVWALPGLRRAADEVWNGSRGRLALDAKLDLAAQGLRLSDVAATLDDTKITGSLSSDSGPDGGLALRLDVDRIDLDRYVPRGFGDFSGPGLGDSGLEKLVDLVGGAMKWADFQLTAQAGELKFHGVPAQDVAIDLGASPQGVELRTVEIGQVGGARVDIAGMLSLPENGVEGSINANVDAEDPRALLRLLGAIGHEERLEPAWAGVLGPLEVKLVAEAGTKERVTTAALALTATAGDASAAIDGQFRGDLAKWEEGAVELTGDMDARSSTLLAAVAGLQLKSASPRPTRLATSVAGSLSGGLATKLEAEAFGARGQFIGSVQAGRRAIEAKGRVALLAEDATELLTFVGAPGDGLSPTAQVLSAESEVTYDGRGLRLSTLRGTAAGSAFSGDVTLVSEPVLRLSGKVDTEALSLPWLLGAILLPSDGTSHAMSTQFSSAVPGLEADLDIAADRVEMLPHVAIESTELELKVGRYDIVLDGRGKGPRGEPATGRLAIGLDSRGMVVKGAVAGPVELGGLLKSGDGTPVIDADGRAELEFSGSGRSPAGVFAGLEAKGSYELAKGVLKRVDPETFARDLAAAKQPFEIDGLFTRSLRGGDMAFVGGSGSLEFADGVLKAKPLPILGEGMTGEARFLLEAASGDVDLSFTLSMADDDNLPTFELAYAGPPQALEPSTDAQDLKSYLSMQMLQDSVLQLEELQRQEQELIEEEEKFQREQEERERLRLEQERRAAEMKLDRKELELAARLKAQASEAEKLKVEQRKADREPVEAAPEPAPGPEAAPEPEAVPEPEPAAARSDVVTAAPLAAEAGDPVPMPRLKPQGHSAPAEAVSVNQPLQMPRDGNLGHISAPVFPGPAVLQPTNSPAALQPAAIPPVR